MPAKLTSPFKFRERILLYGMGGSGKTNAALQVAKAVTPGEFYVVDDDLSAAWGRALETDYADIADRVHVQECDGDWESITNALATQIAAGLAGGDEAARDNWLVVDSLSNSWQAVQNYITAEITGKSSAEYLTNLRASATDLKDMNKQLVDQVPWQIVNKEYAEKIWIPLRTWPGHFIITAEAKKLGRDDLAKAEIADWYEHLGVQPAGQGKIHYVSATTLLMKKGAKGAYQYTTVKDRNREDQENETVGDFAMDYLRGVAGWQVKVVRDG